MDNSHERECRAVSDKRECRFARTRHLTNNELWQQRKQERLINVEHLNTLGFASLKDWLLANERHLYIGRNLAHFIDCPELLKFVHTRHSPFVDQNLTKKVKSQRKLRLIRAIQESKFWSNPYSYPISDESLVNDHRMQEALLRFKWLVDGTDRRSYVYLLEGRIFGCWCTPRPCHGEHLLALAVESERKREINCYFTNPYVYLKDEENVKWKGDD